ncbi:hypothetical protein ACSQ76_12205 [Roseovarius sp. B08]|uniref:hypothetical protein n=1 Tax=Roseovarius sp. B08 TaxID=3449223 RepID=UPI003EDBD7F5
MIRDLIFASIGLAVIAGMGMKIQALRVERDAFKGRLEAVAGSREIENVTREMDDCSLFDVLTGGVRPDDGGDVLGCSEGAADDETGDGGIPDQE